MELIANDDGCGSVYKDEQTITGTIKIIHMERDNVIASAGVMRCEKYMFMTTLSAMRMVIMTQPSCLVVDLVMNKHLVQSI